MLTSVQFAATSLGGMAYVSNADECVSEVAQERSPLLFLHGFGGGASAYEWSKVYPAFASTRVVIAPDLMGWGRSQHPARSYVPEDYLLTLREFICQVSDRPVVAIASSLTAGLVVRLAVKHPDLFESLFLVCPSGFRDFGRAAGRRIPLPVINTPTLDRAIYALGATTEFAVRSFLERFLLAERDRLSSETVTAYLASAKKTNAEYTALSFLRGDLYFDLAKYLPDLTLPTAFVWGESAQFVPSEVGQKLAGLNRDRIHSYPPIPNVGIFPHLEVPAVAVGLLHGWLDATARKT